MDHIKEIALIIKDLHEQRLEQLETYKSLNIYHGSLEYDDNPQLSMFEKDKYNSYSLHHKSLVICSVSKYEGCSYKETLTEYKNEWTDMKTYSFPMVAGAFDIKVHNASFAYFSLSEMYKGIPMDRVGDIFTLEGCTKDSPLFNSVLATITGNRPAIHTDGNCIEINVIRIVNFETVKKLCCGLRMFLKNCIIHDSHWLCGYSHKDGKLHGLSIVDKDKFWYKDGDLHREDGPAIEYSNGTEEWYKDGKLHREDGPASVDADGSKSWYKDGKRHRDDGPAIERKDGTLEWWKNGELHRDDGPAIENVNGTLEWHKDGVLHREDGPAIEYANGDKEWYTNGECHRDDDKPAYIGANGNKSWYKNGNRHRDDDKPAIEYDDGDKFWRKNGIPYTPIWEDVHTRVAIKLSVLELPMLILLELASRIPYKTVLTEYQITEIISSIRNEPWIKLKNKTIKQ